MKIFYLHEDGHPCGPFSLSELQSKNINLQTPIWKEGMPEWVTAENIDEIKSFLIKTPPPFHAKQERFGQPEPTAFMTATEKTGFKLGKALGWTGLIALLIIIISFITYNNSNSSYKQLPTFSEPARQKTPEEIKLELLQSEQLSPRKYITGQVKNWNNFYGERVIQLQLTNTATLAGFKDLVVNVTFLSKTGTELGDEEFTVFDYFKPGQTITHKVRTFAPGGTKNVSVRVISAISL